MHIIALGWMFVVVLMALAEATSGQGTVLGAIVTLLLYGVLPLCIVLYILGTPMRRRARQRADAAQQQAHDDLATPPSSGPQGDAGGHPTGAPLAPEREEP